MLSQWLQLLIFHCLTSLAFGRNVSGLDGTWFRDMMLYFVSAPGQGAVQIEQKLLHEVDMSRYFNTSEGPLITSSLLPPEFLDLGCDSVTSNHINKVWAFCSRTERARRIVLEGSIENGKFVWERVELALDQPHMRSSMYPGAWLYIDELQQSVYLGGTYSDPQNSTTYRHELLLFDASSRTFSTSLMPDFVPVVDQGVYLIYTGNKRIALGVIGGQLAEDKTLKMAFMNTTSIYDFTTKEWYQQTLTGFDGETHNEESAIPEGRLDPCVTLDSAQDRSSYNLVLYGGHDGTHDLSDAWSLSFPSMMWNRAPLKKEEIFGVVSSICIEIHSRYLLMATSSFLQARNVLHQNISIPKSFRIYEPSIMNTTTSYTPSTVGYFVHESIYNIIGGDLVGHANITEPVFTNFSSPAVRNIFKKEASTTQSHLSLRLILVCCLVPPFSLYILSWVVEYISTRKRKLRRHWALRWSFFILTQSFAICLLAMVHVLQKASSLPDLDREHFSAGIESEGIWTGGRFDSYFIRKSGEAYLPRGLLWFFFDEGTTGEWSQKNGMQTRLGPIPDAVTAFLPTLLAMMYSLFWKLIDAEVKRHEVPYQIATSREPFSASLLNTSYHIFWTPLNVSRAIHKRHYLVAVTSFSVLVSSIILPICSNYIFYWELYSGAQFGWENRYSYKVLLVDRTMVIVSSLLIGLTMISGVTVFAVVQCRENASFMMDDKHRGIMYVVHLLHKAEKLFTQQDTATHGIDRLPPSLLEAVLTSHPVSVHTTSSGHRVLVNSPQSLPSRKYQRRFAPFKKLIYTYEVMSAWVYDSPHFFVFRLFVLAVWLTLLVLTLSLVAILLSNIERNAESALDNYTIPLPTNLYIVLAVGISSLHASYEDAVKLMAPVHYLNKADQDVATLYIDYTRPGIPVIEIFQAFWHGHWLVALHMLSVWATILFTVYLGALQQSSSSYGSTSFRTDRLSATAATILIGSALLANAVVGWQFCSLSRDAVLCRSPGTIVSTILLVQYSSHLRKLAEITTGLPEGDPLTLSTFKGVMFRFGGFEDRDGVERIGVEVQAHVNGSGHRVKSKPWGMQPWLMRSLEAFITKCGNFL